jgi:hypothetical protein
MVLIFIIALIVLSVGIGLTLNWMRSALFQGGDSPEPPNNPRDLDDPEQRSEFERRYPPTNRSWDAAAYPAAHSGAAEMQRRRSRSIAPPAARQRPAVFRA